MGKVFKSQALRFKNIYFKYRTNNIYGSGFNFILLKSSQVIHIYDWYDFNHYRIKISYCICIFEEYSVNF
ncbi:hypothetical protein BAX95_02510 [Elizabethkingia meningoseptica]|nr:hypothetical protein BAX95_02510 [Elizabethkingia meningoseptica]